MLAPRSRGRVQAFFAFGSARFCLFSFSLASTTEKPRNTRNEPRNSLLMTRKTYALALLLFLLGQAPLTLRPAEAQPASEDRPNIVFIFADDLGYGDIEPYGQDKINTPNLARMAREGLRFTQFYAGATVCAPSRSVLMTGLNMGRTPVRGNAPTFDEEGIVTGQTPLPAEVKTVAEVLQDAGYRTGGFGKWGLGGLGTEGRPTQQGFDEFYGYLDQWRAHFFWPEYLIHNDEKVPLEGNKTKKAYTTLDATSEDLRPIPGAGPPHREGDVQPRLDRREGPRFYRRQPEPALLPVRAVYHPPRVAASPRKRAGSVPGRRRRKHLPARDAASGGAPLQRAGPAARDVCSYGLAPGPRGRSHLGQAGGAGA